MNTRELYEKYYSATVNRYYGGKEKARLISLFAAACGEEEGSSEVKLVREVIESVEKFGIETVMDCKNFLLIADSIPGKSELLRAVRAAKSCFEKYEAVGRRTYSDVVDWRTDVYRNLRVDAAAKLDVAYIEYSRGASEKALGRFSELADEMAHLPSVEYLAVIYAKGGKYREALFWLFVLSEVLANVLSIDCPEFISKRIEEASEHLTAGEINETKVNATKKVKEKFSYGQINRGSIGFLARN